MRHTPCGCRSAHLVEVRSNSRLPPVSTMRRAKQCRYFARSPPPSKRHSRLTIVRRGCNRERLAEDSWRSHVHRTYIAQRVQLFEIETANIKRLSFGRATPVFFLGKENGGRITRHLCRIDIRTCAKKEEFSFEKENIPLSRIPCTVQGKNPSPLKGYHLLPVNKKSAPRFSKTARNIRFANPSPHA